MSFTLLVALKLVICSGCVNCHSPIHYQLHADSGEYNFGYDTGTSGSHQFHQEHKHVNGQVRGRYGYIDPYGKQRTINYKSGPKGFEIIEDNYSAIPMTITSNKLKGLLSNAFLF